MIFFLKVYKERPFDKPKKSKTNKQKDTILDIETILSDFGLQRTN